MSDLKCDIRPFLVALARYLQMRSTSRPAVSSSCLAVPASPDPAWGGLCGARVASSSGGLLGGLHASQYKLVRSCTADSLVCTSTYVYSMPQRPLLLSPYRQFVMASFQISSPTPYYKWNMEYRISAQNYSTVACLTYHAAFKVEFQPINRSYSQLTFFNFY